MPVKIWRNGQEQDVSVTVKSSGDDLAEGNQYDVKPRYFVFGGLVFTPLSRDYLRDSSREASEGTGRNCPTNFSSGRVKNRKPCAKSRWS